jgi:3-oxoacyl-[acyl-carrier protein] reductase
MGSSKRLEGILLTGASSDIGKELVGYFVDRQDLKILATSNSQPCPPLLSNRNDTVALEGIDLTLESGLDQVASAATQFFQGPFGIVHSVGAFWEHKPIPDCDLNEARNLIGSHYLSLYGLLNRILPLMAQLGGGRILAFSCTSVGFHYPDMAAFTSAKAAVESLIRCTANEWSRHYISSNAIALSTIATPKVMTSKPLAKEENYVTPKEICQLVEDILFSSSPYLSGNVIRPLKYSETFYNRSYFERNPPLS